MSEAPKEDKLSHPCFPQPANKSVRVWRYLDLPKFIWTLSNRKMWLPRVDLLNDPHEGSTPRMQAFLRDRFYEKEGLAKLVEAMPGINRKLLKSCYVNCWRMGNGESEAMWRLYCPGSHGIAIQTTYQKLVDSIAHDPALYIGVLSYIDYETQGYPQDNMFYRLMHKRISFSHESEIRLIKTLAQHWGMEAEDGPPGIAVDWDIEPITEAVFVDPYAPEFYVEVVNTVVQNLAPKLKDRIVWSEMRGAPTY